MSRAGQALPGSGTIQTATAPGDPWSPNTIGMISRGYDIHQIKRKAD
jgi:hypothetical protein